MAKSKVANGKPEKANGGVRTTSDKVPFLLRMPPQKHAALKEFADQSSRSLHAAILYLATTNPEFVQHVRFSSTVEAV